MIKVTEQADLSEEALDIRRVIKGIWDFLDGHIFASFAIFCSTGALIEGTRRPTKRDRRSPYQWRAQIHTYRRLQKAHRIREMNAPSDFSEKRNESKGKMDEEKS
jgi:hypothetical protein